MTWGTRGPVRAFAAFGLTLTLACAISANACAAGAAAPPAPRKTLTPFQSDEELRQFVLARLIRERDRVMTNYRGAGPPPPSATVLLPGVPNAAASISSAPRIPGAPDRVTMTGTTNVENLLNQMPQSFADFGSGNVPGTVVETMIVTGSRVPSPQGLVSASPLQVVGSAEMVSESITNVQEQGVDEGDIVKLRGDMLIILRRGRLFTVSISGGRMRALDSIDAYPPNVDASSDWYDEMLVSADRVVVIGYSYGRGGTEINRFRLGADGKLSFEDAYHLRSDDYYSSRNYASRLIGKWLIFYAPLYLSMPLSDPLAAFPAFRRWTGDAHAPFHRIARAQQIYRSPRPDSADDEALHTVVTCDTLAPEMECKAVGIVGAEGRGFYVSPRAVYVWVAPYGDDEHFASGQLYRMPLDGTAPSAIGVGGVPIDQFSFREDAAEGILNVLAFSSGGGDAMWNSERVRGAMALLRLPIADFGDGSRDAPREYYRRLPTPHETEDTVQNRFIGDYLLYGAGVYWGGPRDGGSVLYVTPVRGGEVAQLPLIHTVDRIDIMGGDAVVIGADKRNLYFSSVLLASGGAPAPGDRYVMHGAAQAETRSHGFFFKPEPGEGEGDGVIGLPIARANRPGFHHLFESAAAMLFLRRSGGRFIELGELEGHERHTDDDTDQCVASCTDWYGNARPIFIRERTFALMGYELIEGRARSSDIDELARLNFAPPVRPQRQAEVRRPIAEPPTVRPAPDLARDDPQWQYDASGDCWAWMPAVWGKVRAVAWTGSCEGRRATGYGVLIADTEGWPQVLVRGNFVDGKLRRGTLWRSDGQRNEGTFLNGLLEGEGLIRFGDGTEFRGTFRAGALNGHGMQRYADGTRLSGEFRGGGLTQGTWLWPSGARYDGALAEGRFHGAGSLTWPNGDRFTGTFTHGLEEGPGRYALADGATLSATFHLGFVTGPAALHRRNGTTVTGAIMPPHADAAHPIAAPDYPPLSQRLNEEGRVVLRFYVDADGTVHVGQVIASSGKARLDMAALAWLRRTRRLPATMDGVPVPAVGLHTVTFKLNDPPPQPPPPRRSK